MHRRYTGTCVLESAKFFKLRRDAAVISSTKSARAISPGCMIQARYVIVVTSQPVVIPYSRFEVHALIKLSPLPHLRFLTLRPLPRPESDEHLSSTRPFRLVLLSLPRVSIVVAGACVCARHLPPSQCRYGIPLFPSSAVYSAGLHVFQYPSATGLATDTRQNRPLAHGLFVSGGS